MKVRKQSMRQVRDAAMIDRQAPRESRLVEQINAREARAGQPRYFRGAIVKPK